MAINRVNCPRKVGRLTSLARLDLSHNQLVQLLAAAGYLIALEFLHLKNNPLRRLPAEVGQLPRLVLLESIPMCSSYLRNVCQSFHGAMKGSGKTALASKGKG